MSTFPAGDAGVVSELLISSNPPILSLAIDESRSSHALLSVLACVATCADFTTDILGFYFDGKGLCRW